MTNTKRVVWSIIIALILILAGGVIIAARCSAFYEPDVDYSVRMMECCVAGDVSGGTKAAESRNEKIVGMELDYPQVDFEDLWFLSKIITAEAGSNWLPAEWKMAVGEVVLNRCASPEFPDSITEVIFQRGQYYNIHSNWFSSLIPYVECVDAAWRLLNGERVLDDPKVVFQANFAQGSGVALHLYDRLLGHTYFCYTSHPELY